MNSELVIVDCGKNSSTMLRKGKKIEVFTHKDLFDQIINLPSGTKVVCEEAHLGTPRRGLSKSQPVTED